jgi:hypothetical protein
MKIAEAIMKTIRWIKKQFGELNLFNIENIHLEAFDLRTAIISTHAYIILLSFALIILTVFTALDGQSQTIIVRNPTHSTFINLHQHYHVHAKR